jgi:DNA-directed RNA polymerase sigma subunit (sigma70/sigma32)
MPTTREDLDEEVKNTPAELTIPLGELEEPGVEGAPARMYLREIERMPVLTANEERHLAHQVEIGKCIHDIQQISHKQNCFNPTPTEIIQCILREIGQATPLIHGLRKELDIKQAKSLKDVMGNPQLCQIEAKALRKLRHPRRSRKLRVFME